MSWIIHQLLDNVPWWAWGGAAAIVATFTAKFWLPLWAAMPGSVRGAVVGVAAVGMAYLAGRNKGSSTALELERKAQEEARQKAITIRKETDDEVGALGHADVDRDLAKWMRDRKG